MHAVWSVRVRPTVITVQVRRTVDTDIFTRIHPFIYEYFLEGIKKFSAHYSKCLYIVKINVLVF